MLLGWETLEHSASHETAEQLGTFLCSSVLQPSCFHEFFLPPEGNAIPSQFGNSLEKPSAGWAKAPSSLGYTRLRNKMAENIPLWKITACSFGGLWCLKLRGLSITRTQSPCWSLLLLESTAIKWLKCYTNKAISCFYWRFHCQCLIAESFPSTSQWLMSGAWQLSAWACSSPRLSSHCAAHPAWKKLPNLTTVQAQFMNCKAYICFPLRGERRQWHGHIIVRHLWWGMSLPLTLARLTPVGTL